MKKNYFLPQRFQITRIHFFCFAFVVLFSSLAKAQVEVPQEMCLNGFEQQLYALVDQYRSENEAHKITVSKKLTYVAKLHARDLFHNQVDKDSCSMQSWSDKGFWEACCFNEQDNNKMPCMWDKPREIAGYDGKAYEVIYNGGSSPSRIMDLWKASSFYSDILKNAGRYADKDWVSIGIGNYKNVTVVWFGEAEDQSGEVQYCTGAEPELDLKTGGAKLVADSGSEENSSVTTLTADNSDGATSSTPEKGKFYLIYGSYETMENAQAAVRQLSGKFPQAKVITTNDSERYRVALYEYNTKEEAQDAQNKLDYTYVGAWVLGLE